jgi:membrane protein DedA with SNARE-associated domain
VIDWLLERMLALPAGFVYLIIGVFAALENIVPPVPADTVALFGGFLIGQIGGSAWIAFFYVWVGNVLGALLVYGAGRRYGPRFFATPLGSRLLAPRQLERLGFAGTARLGFWTTAVPLGMASAIWYGALVFLGARAGENWDALRAGVEGASRWLLLAALVVAVPVAIWWWRTRRETDGH